MSIRLRIILIVVPLFIFILILTSSFSALTARAGLIELAVQNFSFKSNQFEKSIVKGWDLLVENQISDDPDFIAAFETTLLAEAGALTETESESIFAFNESTMDLLFDTGGRNIAIDDLDRLFTKLKQESPNQSDALEEQAAEAVGEDSLLITPTFETENTSALSPRSWINGSFDIDGVSYVGYYFVFPERGMVVVFAITRQAFLKPVVDILYITLVIIIFAIIVSATTIISFSKTLVKPLKSMLGSMHRIIETNSFNERVDVVFRDEVGQLSQTFNVMIEELDKAYQQIKQYALSAVVAKKNESKIRNIFQKYVPVNVINSLFKDPARMLSGENRYLTLMFTDIRSFTAISETYRPDELVNVLNQYFEKLVDIITGNEGVIDKYIGDAIMAFFGAPMDLPNSPLSAVTAGIRMIQTLDAFNENLKKKELPQFITGIGINYGLVTVGNIGSDKKMDYTAIGDAVNLGARLEGLTKQYKQNMIFSQTVRDAVFDVIPCRIIDLVRVKGKTGKQKIYTTTPYASDKILTAFSLHNSAFNEYLKRDFNKAIRLLNNVLKLIPNDIIAQMYIERCEAFKKNPPSDSWDGTAVITSK